VKEQPGRFHCKGSEEPLQGAGLQGRLYRRQINIAQQYPQNQDGETELDPDPNGTMA
jgi:hypothetical protein